MTQFLSALWADLALFEQSQQQSSLQQENLSHDDKSATAVLQHHLTHEERVINLTDVSVVVSEAYKEEFQREEDKGDDFNIIERSAPSATIKGPHPSFLATVVKKRHLHKSPAVELHFARKLTKLFDSIVDTAKQYAQRRYQECNSNIAIAQQLLKNNNPNQQLPPHLRDWTNGALSAAWESESAPAFAMRRQARIQRLLENMDRAIRQFTGSPEGMMMSFDGCPYVLLHEQRLSPFRIITQKLGVHAFQYVQHRRDIEQHAPDGHYLARLMGKYHRGWLSLIRDIRTASLALLHPSHGGASERKLFNDNDNHHHYEGQDGLVQNPALRYCPLTRLPDDFSLRAVYQDCVLTFMNGVDEEGHTLLPLNRDIPEQCPYHPDEITILSDDGSRMICLNCGSQKAFVEATVSSMSYGEDGGGPMQKNNTQNKIANFKTHFRAFTMTDGMIAKNFPETEEVRQYYQEKHHFDIAKLKDNVDLIQCIYHALTQMKKQGKHILGPAIAYQLREGQFTVPGQSLNQQQFKKTFQTLLSPHTISVSSSSSRMSIQPISALHIIGRLGNHMEWVKYLPPLSMQTRTYAAIQKLLIHLLGASIANEVLPPNNQQPVLPDLILAAAAAHQQQ